MKEIEVINKNENFEPLIIWATNQEEIKKEVDLIDDKKYNRIYDGLGGVLKTEHNTQFNDYKYCLGGVSIPTIYVLFETRFQATIPPKKTKPKNKLDLPMKAAKPFKPCFLNHFNNFDVCSYVDNNGECVLKTIYDVLNRDRRHFLFQFLRDKFNEASLFSYGYKYKKKRGITARMLKYVAEKLNFSLLGFDSNTIEFVRNTPNRNQRKDLKAIVFYIAINSLTRANCDYITDLTTEEEIKQKIFVRNESDYSKLENGTINIIDDDLNEKLFDLIAQRITPKVKYSSLSIVSQITINENKKNIILVNPGNQTNQQMTPETTKEICDKAGIVFTNQSIGTLLVDLQKQFFKPVREPISKETRTKIFNEQVGICKGCNEALGEKYELDHIQPVSGGGTNNRDNLQFLCKACHTEK